VSANRDDTRSIVVDAVERRFGTRAALAGVSFTVAPGEIFGLLGPNGSGKTTLFRIISTLLDATGGRVAVAGHDVATEAHAVRRQLGVVFQSPALDSRLTVRENLRHHGHLYGLRGGPLDSRIATALDALRVAERAGDVVETLSGGLRRRAEVAKALLPQPRVLVLDEPSSGLDPNARRELWEAVRTLRDTAGTTVVLTTHLMDEAARCDRVAILHHGRLVALGTPDALTRVVGGEVLWVSGESPDDLASGIATRFDVDARIVDGRVRIEHPRAHELVPQVVEAFPGRIEAISVSRPTLEDVFVHHTGERFE
jgi:ABC-2 type transport system ATP-binding protein